MPVVETRTGGRRIRGLDAAQRRAQRRDQLLEAALELFATQGYANTSIEQICQTAYVGTKGFYELFANKEACYLALLDQIAQDVSRRLVEGLRDAPTDERQAARRLTATFAHAVVDDPRRARAAFGEGAGVSAAVDRQRRINRRWGAQFVQTVWRRYGVDEHTIRPGVDMHRVAVGLIGGLFDLIVDWLHDAEVNTDSDLGADSSSDPGSGTTSMSGREASSGAGRGPGEPGDVETLIADLTTFYELVRSGLTGGAEP